MSSGTNQKVSSLTNNQQLKPSHQNFQASNGEKDKSSLLQKWFGSQGGQQDSNKQMEHCKKNGISWGEDIHYII